MILKEIISLFENFAPLSYQESYDNSGLIVGDINQKINSALLSIDITEETIDEAIKLKSNLIISHHPIIFSGLKKITECNSLQRIIRRCIKNDIAIYTAHTNLDSVIGGVNSKICEKLNLINCKILSPVQNTLKKIVVFVPENHVDKVRNAMFSAGAGHIGDYDCCSFNTNGSGTFRGLENSNQFTGIKGQLHIEREIKVETIVEAFKLSKVIDCMINAHPYEEVAYDIYTLENKNNNVGLGMYGDFEKPKSVNQLLKLIKKEFNTHIIRYSGSDDKKIKKVAVCGGSGSSFINDAKRINADVFITADIKYHQFFEAKEKNILLLDIGHYESEQYTVEVFYDIIKKNIPNFTVYLSQICTNPIKYF